VTNDCNTFIEGMNPGWVEWTGGECPVPFKTIVQIKLRDGAVERPRIAGFWMRTDDDRSYWQHEPNDHNNDIVAYRVVHA